MIHESLSFLAAEVNRFLNQKLEVSTDPRLVLGNISRALDGDTTNNNLSNRAILSLINIEEDRISKEQRNYFPREEGNIVYKNPPVYLNLYVIIAVNLNNYSDGLKWLTYIMQFFQANQVFTPASHPALNTNIEKLVTELYSINFEQINNLWSVLGGKYFPSVIYRLRQVTIDEDAIQFEGGVITEIQLSGNSIDN